MLSALWKLRPFFHPNSLLPILPSTMLQLRTTHEDLTFFKEVKSIPAAVAVHIFLGQDVFPQLPWETGSRIPGQPSSQTAVLGSQLFRGYEPAWETQPLETLDSLQI